MMKHNYTNNVNPHGQKLLFMSFIWTLLQQHLMNLLSIDWVQFVIS